MMRPSFAPRPSVSASPNRLLAKARAAAMGVAWMGLLAVAGASSMGCSKTYIPNTDVEDAGENRKIVLFCEDYRHAVEEKDVSKLLSMTSPQYFEDGGNALGIDDMDAEGLKDYLTTTFARTVAIRYEIRYRRVTVNSNSQVYVDYTYAAAYKIPTPKGEEWKHTVADNRLVLVPDGEGYKILAGM